MSDLEDAANQEVSEPPLRRCHVCDSLLPQGASHCLMCGAEVMPAGEGLPPPGLAAAVETLPPVPAAGEEAESPDFLPPVVESVMVERRSQASRAIAGTIALVTVAVALLILRNPVPAQLSLVPTLTPIPPTPSYTPTWTPLPGEASPTAPPATPTPLPTATPQPPRVATVAPGDTLVAFAFRFGVDTEAIANLNGLPPENPIIREGQTLLIPWPTATPPLTSVELQIGDERIIANPDGCDRYEIQPADTMGRIAAEYNIPVQALLQVNRLTEQSLIRPGDTVCIPQINVGVALLPTPDMGDLSAEGEERGPDLLYPANLSTINPAGGRVVLQWLAARDLAGDEAYMVELSDLDAVGSHPWRGFTRDSSWPVPASWRPTVPESHLMRWNVRIVTLTGQRGDGSVTYTYREPASRDRFFYWLGAVPAPTATATPTLTPTPTP